MLIHLFSLFMLVVLIYCTLAGLRCRETKTCRTEMERGQNQSLPLAEAQNLLVPEHERRAVRWQLARITQEPHGSISG